MYNTTKLFLLPILAIGMLFIFSCKDEEPPAPERDKFFGIYDVEETCQFGTDSYDISIVTSNASDNSVILSNLYDYDEDLNATVSGDNITIPIQTVDGLEMGGTGTLVGTTLTIDFTVGQGNYIDDCVAVCTAK